MVGRSEELKYLFQKRRVNEDNIISGKMCKINEYNSEKCVIIIKINHKYIILLYKDMFIFWQLLIFLFFLRYSICLSIVLYSLYFI